MLNKKFDLSNRFFVIITLLVLGVLIYFVGQIVLQSRTLDQQNMNQITVSGEGTVYVAPDIATVILGAKTDGANVKNITDTNNVIVNKIIKDVKDLGVDEKDIKTQQYSVSPKYNYTYKNGTIPAGYVVQQNIQVKIRDFSKIGAILDVPANNGGNIVTGLRFTLDNPETSKEEARAKAIEQAKQKAQTLAGQTGMQLGKIINVYENYYPSAMYSEKAIGMGGANMEQPVTPDIQPGQQEVSVTINLTYRLK